MKAFKTLQEVRNAIAAGEITLPALLQHYFTVIKENEHLNAFVEVFFNSATAQAQAVHAKILNGTAGRLAGMVLGIKDNICYKDHKVSAASKMLDGFVAPYSATVVEKLMAEDAVIIGRLNCDEFAMGGSNETSFFGPVRNFANPALVSGGSSGGSAVAVQAGMCLAALGTDTGGSVRQPAAFCGVVGFKPTYGRNSRYGIIAYASSFDQVGTLTNSVADAALLAEILAGADSNDSTTAENAVDLAIKPDKPQSSKRIAVLGDMMESVALDTEIKNAITRQLDELKTQGHAITYVNFGLLDYLVPAYYVLTTAEASSNLSRYDGVRYGHRSAAPENLTEMYRKSRAEGFGPEVKRRIMLGTFVLSAGYYDAYYQKAQRVRRLISERFEQIFENYDFVISPVTPTPPFPIGAHGQDPLVMYMADIFTVPASLAGLPAIALPIGNNKEGLPLSMQVLGKKFDEASLLAFAAEVNRYTN